MSGCGLDALASLTALLPICGAGDWFCPMCQDSGTPEARRKRSSYRQPQSTARRGRPAPPAQHGGRLGGNSSRVNGMPSAKGAAAAGGGASAAGAGLATPGDSWGGFSVPGSEQEDTDPNANNSFDLL